LRFIHNWVNNGHPMDGALVGAGSLWPPTPLHMVQSFWIWNKRASFLYFTLGKGLPPLIFRFLHFQKLLSWLSRLLRSLSLSSVSFWDWRYRLVWLRVSAESNRWVFFFPFFFFGWRILLFSLSGKSFICKIYGDHRYEDLDNSGYNPDIKIK